MNEDQAAIIPDQWTLLTLVALSVLMTAIFAYNAKQAWDDRRDYGDGRALRAFLMAFLLAEAMVIIMLGRISSAFFATDPGARDTIRFLSVALSGSIIAIGISIAISNRKHP